MERVAIGKWIGAGGAQSRRAMARARFLGTTMLSSTVILAFSLPASANPDGGTVAAGQASIAGGAGQTTVQQNSQKAVINWKSFSIDKGETTRFVQPNKDAITLNRVTGGSRSDINGMLQANGNVWLINPNGVLIGPSAQINVNGFLATTADIPDTDFMAGRYNFSVPSPNPKAEVINQGTISIGETGLAGLVAPHVRNDGVISGYLGQVVLAGTPTFTLDLQGDGLIQFAVGSQVAGDALVPGKALVETPGVISVDGGRVLLTASAAAGVVDTVINMDGAIEAHSVAMRDGAIVLDGGGNGVVQVAGSLDASAIGSSGKGGAVDVLGDRVLVADGAVIDASGPDGGGTIHIGGDLRGRGPRREASATLIAEGATVSADATKAGDGGQVVAWGDDYLGVAGSISARGGPDGGNGGFVETSSKGGMAVTGTIDTTAPAGKAGKWLLDPLNVSIVDTVPEGETPSDLPVLAGDPPTDGTAFVLASAIGDSSANEVVIQATQNINVLASFFNFSAGGVQLSAGNDLSISGGIRIEVDNIRFDVGGRMTIGADASIVGLGSGTTILINTNSFTNQAGSGGLQPAGGEGSAGRFLVYSQNPANDQPNLTPGTFGEIFGVAFNPSNPDGVGIVPADGNFLIYAPAPPPPTPCASCITTVETQDIDVSGLFAQASVPERLLLVYEPENAAPPDSIRGGDPGGLHANDGNRELWTPEEQQKP